jgi:hypothetical protein
MNVKYAYKPIQTQTNPLKPFVENCTLNAIRWTLIPKTNPIFSQPNMRYQYQKRRNGGQKTTRKNETNPILTNA